MILFCDDQDIRDLTTTREGQQLDAIVAIDRLIESGSEYGYINDLFNLCFVNEKSRATISRAKEVVEKCKEKYGQDLVPIQKSEKFSSSLVGSSSEKQTDEERFAHDITQSESIDISILQEPEKTIGERYAMLIDSVTNVRNTCNSIGKKFNSLTEEERDNYLNERFTLLPRVTHIPKLP